MLESLVSLGILAMVVSLFLSAIDLSRQRQESMIKEQELYNVMKMAVQTRQAHLEKNGLSVQVERNQHKIQVFSQGKEIILVEKD